MHFGLRAIPAISRRVYSTGKRGSSNPDQIVVWPYGNGDDKSDIYVAAAGRPKIPQNQTHLPYCGMTELLAHLLTSLSVIIRSGGGLTVDCLALTV